jgi:hypothetical protein
VEADYFNKKIFFHTFAVYPLPFTFRNNKRREGLLEKPPAAKFLSAENYCSRTGDDAAAWSWRADDKKI